jgi:CheY-like chemotaxis protein
MKIEYKRTKTRRQVVAEYKTAHITESLKTNAYQSLETKVCKSLFSILVVVENRTVATSIVNCLKVTNEFSNVKVVDSPKEAIEAMKDVKYNLILSEYRMSKGDGTDVLKAYPSAPVVFISGFTDYERSNLVVDSKVCLPLQFNIDHVLTVTMAYYVNFLRDITNKL